MLTMIKKQLVQAGILLAALGVMMVLGGMIEGGLSLLTGLGALAVLASLLYGLICVLESCSRPAKRTGTARTKHQGNAGAARRSEGLQVA